MDISKIENNITIKPNKCWLWKGAVSSTGYGNLEEDNKQYTPHAYAYQCVNGKIPKNKVLRHKCNNKLCCNPNHLELGTVKDNYEDSKENHRKADAKRRSRWMVDGILYPTCQDAVDKTGISMNSIVKYTRNGKFNRTSYEKACKLSGTYPVKPVK